MDEITKQFYEEVDRFAPRNHKNQIDWKTLLVGEYDANILANYYQSRKRGVLPPVYVIAAMISTFSKEELKRYALHKLRTTKKLTNKVIEEYENVFREGYSGRRPGSKVLNGTSEERELEIKRQRTPFEKKKCRKLFMERVWQMEAAGLIGQSDSRDGYNRKD
ncbi:hypothetical protein JEQ21_08100 [Streptococcus sp. 121]|uniref:hypothetical protein n=1 Tax=Streptococcus sp. 121 TaxID=2797637 RepID=UPI0018F0CF85|nr:hypothetical protein [Streptococcus sp. 121]MBJ6746412.1 hypothetical protein [Streptococcus sp. 121]